MTKVLQLPSAWLTTIKAVPDALFPEDEDVVKCGAQVRGAYSKPHPSTQDAISPPNIAKDFKGLDPFNQRWVIQGLQGT
jgi:hypothetical protein